MGGGFAGVKLALELGRDEHFEVTLLSPHDQLEYHGALYRSATGRSPLEVVLPFREIFRGYPGVNLVNDYMVELRAASKEIKGQSGETYGYDAVVLTIGYEKEYFNTLGASEHTESIYTIFDAIKLRNRLQAVFEKKQIKSANIVVVGAGPAGVEVAGDISKFAKIVADQLKIKVAQPLVTIVDRAPKVLPMMSEEVSKKALERLKSLGIKFIGNAAVDHCNTRHLCLANSRMLKADVIIWTAGNRASAFFEQHPDLFTLDPKKRVLVGEYMQANSPNIYVLGDAASTPYSGMAQTAINDAEQLAANFKRYVRGQTLVPYEPRIPIYVVPIGEQWAISQKGDKVLTGKAGWRVRREADFFVIRSFLPESLAKKHWERATQVAELLQ